jgi:cysteine-rich repeat protein
MLLVSIVAGCSFDPVLEGAVFVRCGDDGACPTGSTCIVALQRCVPAETECVVGEGDDVTAADDGTSCGAGAICVQGACVTARCGDGFRGRDEACDDGEGNSDTRANACRTTCEAASCGDAVVDDDEVCDDGDDNSATTADACRPDCTRPRCGDGVRDSNEACDDGNTESGDGCRGTCDKIEACGDGVVDDGEQCDDENGNVLDLCGGCQAFSWTPEVVAGLGAEQGDPRQMLVGPLAVAVDRAGNVYAADILTSTIYRLDAAEQKVTRFAGTASLTSLPRQRAGGVRATDVNATGVLSMHVSAAGDLYIADTDESSVRRIDAVTGRVVDVAGNGSNEVSGDGGPGTLAGIGDPRDIATDGEGNVIIADAIGNRLRRVDRISGVITTIAGNGQQGSDGDGGDPLRARTTPRSVDVDAAGNVYVWEDGNVLRRLVVDPADRRRFLRIERLLEFSRPGDTMETIAVSPSGDHVYATSRSLHGIFDLDVVRRTEQQIAGTGVEGFNGDGPANQAQLNRPGDVVVLNDDTLIVADAQNGRVRRLSRGPGGAWTLDTLMGVGLDGIADIAGYLAPRILQIGGGGMGLRAQLDCTDQVDVALSQPGLHQIFLKDACTGAFRLVGGTGERGSSGDGGPALAATFDAPRGLAIDAAGNIFVADPGAHVVRRIGADGVVTHVAGTGAAGFSGDGGPAASARLNRPTGVAVDDRGRIVIADAGNHRLRRVDPGTGVITTIIGTGVEAPGTDGANLATQTLAEPIAVSFVSASGLATGATGGLLVFTERTGHRVRALVDVVIPGVPPAFLPVQTTTIAGDGVEGYLDDVDGLRARFSHPRALGAIISDACPRGCVLVLDGIDRVRRLTIDIALGFPPRIESSVSTDLGGDGATDDGPLSSARLLGPSALAAFGDDAALVVDRVSGRLRRIDFAAGRIDTVAGLPEGLDVGDVAVNARQARPFDDPGGIVVDNSASPPEIYVAERGADVIRRVTAVDVTDSSTWTTDIVCGSSGSPGYVDGACSDARFAGPAGLALDVARGLLFVADEDNHVVRRIDLGTGVVQTLVGQPGLRGAYVDDGVRAQDALLDTPSALVVVGDALFVADAGVHRVVRVDAAASDDLSTPTVHPVLGDGIAASSGDGRPAAFFTVDTPEGIAADAAGNLFVTSQQALRFVGAGDDLADGADEVVNVYGAPPRARFPEPVTRCLNGVTLLPGGDVLAADGCVGLLLRLRRAPASP